MRINKITVISLVFFIVYCETAQDVSQRSYDLQRSSLSRVELSECSYNGSINNSTMIELGNCFNTQYFIGLNIGTGPQYFNFQFDTGSPTFWIPLGSNPKAFDHNVSSTYKITDKFFQQGYGGGTMVSGNLGSDIVTVNGTSISINTSILFAKFSTSKFPNTSIYGIVGMDYGSYPNFLDIAYQSGQISSPIFCLDLNPLNQTSIMYFNGGIPQEVTDNTVWVPLVLGTQFWEVGLIGMSVNGINMTSIASDSAVIDSGTSLIVLPQDLYNVIIGLYFSTPQCTIGDQEISYCPCNGTWPQLSFMLQGAEVYIPGSAYQTPQGNNGSCQVGIQKLTSLNLTILGDIFFREYAITFDRINNRIGLFGGVTPVSIFDPQYFAIIQYIICGLCIAITFTGIALWLHWKQILQRISKYSSETQQILKIESKENHQIN